MHCFSIQKWICWKKPVLYGGGMINKTNMHSQLSLPILLIQKYVTSSGTVMLLKLLYRWYNTACHQQHIWVRNICLKYKMKQSYWMQQTVLLLFVVCLIHCVFLKMLREMLPVILMIICTILFCQIAEKIFCSIVYSYCLLVLFSKICFKQKSCCLYCLHFFLLHHNAVFWEAMTVG